MIKALGNPLPNGHDSSQINSSLDSQAIQHVNEIFRSQIAGRTRRIRASTKTTGSALDDGNAHLHGGLAIGQRHPTGIMKMGA